MSMDKAIQSGKEHRREYRKAARFDRTCRPGGSCPYCQRGRTYCNRKRTQIADERLAEA